MKITIWHVLLWTLIAFVLLIFWAPVIFMPDCRNLEWFAKGVFGTIILYWMIKKED